MKKNVSRLLVKGKSAQGKVEWHTLPWAYDMAGHALDRVNQLQSLAGMIASTAPESSSSLEMDRHDVIQVMELFSDNLQQIRDLLGEVRGIIEHEPSLKAGANS